MTLLHQAAQKAVEALKYMLREKSDYMRRNKLGDPSKEWATKLVNEAIEALESALQQQPEPVARGVAELEQRYIVFKIKDVERLTQQQRDALYIVTSAVQQRRYERGADQHMPCLVVEKDWPEYAPTLAAILARADGVPAPREGLLPGLSWDEIAALERAPVQQVAPDSEASRRGFEHEVACDSALQHQEVPREPVGERISDERILHLWNTHVGDPSAKYPLSDFDKLEFARAVLRAAVLAPPTTRQQEVGSEPQDCPVCKNGYLAIRTDIYKDGREFVYCDCCGCMADRRVWNRIAAAPSTPENAGGVPASELTEQDAYDMGAKGAQATERERLLFEAWMSGHCWALCATWNGKQYVSDAEQGGDLDPRAMATRRLFAAWRDRAALGVKEGGDAQP